MGPKSRVLGQIHVLNLYLLLPYLGTCSVEPTFNNGTHFFIVPNLKSPHYPADQTYKRGSLVVYFWLSSFSEELLCKWKVKPFSIFVKHGICRWSIYLSDCAVSCAFFLKDWIFFLKNWITRIYLCPDNS